MLGEANFSGSSSKLKERTLVHKRISDFIELQKIYVIGGVIGKGNFGTVVKAKHRDTKICWAIKLINKRQAGASRVLLVEREIHILRLVNHPNIIFLDCVYESPKAIYLVFELCLGSLANTFKEKKQFKEFETMNVLKNLSCALAYLHKNDIVHRDLKLENILITENPIDPEDQLYIKVTDFGLSTMRNGPGHDNMLHDFCGTLTYMAPEMVTTKSYSQQCDVWSMGIIMYVLITGKFPFFSGNEQQLCRLISTAELDYTILQCSEDAKHLLSKLLERNPAFRITAAEVNHHPWISGTKGLLNPRSSNVLDMMRLWKDEILDESAENLDDDYSASVSNLSLQMNTATTSTQTEGRNKSQDHSRTTLDTVDTSVNGSNNHQRTVPARLPDYSWVTARVNTNLPNLRRETQRKKELKSRFNNSHKE